MCLFITNNVIFTKKWNFVTLFTIYYLETSIGDTLGVQSKICRNCVFHRITVEPCYFEVPREMEESSK